MSFHPPTTQEPLAAALERAGMTQIDLARAIDCHPTAVSRWANGHVTPTRIYRKAILRTLRRRGVAVTEEELWGI